ncbi:hypothetical protein BCR37DRAFT_386591 [Protomyces lactucae-debilis]|uniref:Secreted protein n=1 Tax=Protomyces lactucae-debilis TaxID=2754530 RepID=A0A1Y2FM49_PROLT|nr:uncharacterized protein BCR37DRAFT_386591 [Protomyces lactucae-debilis]ORY84434.1 hypothetical protein BCR37DRAFT_386591 [Protomyces lactucae-debilis]
MRAICVISSIVMLATPSTIPRTTEKCLGAVPIDGTNDLVDIAQHSMFCPSGSLQITGTVLKLDIKKCQPGTLVEFKPEPRECWVIFRDDPLKKVFWYCASKGSKTRLCKKHSCYFRVVEDGAYKDGRVHAENCK